ncbi:MAG: bifunctional nicotinamide-nucleotide adenylyltransferase/Nudix hydroxylase [Francisellaceae bacterium]
MKFDFGVFIGRFQPFHVGHLHNIKTALKQAERMIIAVGSSFRAPSMKNPFSFESRRQMIIEDLSCCGVDIKRIDIVPIADWFYHEAGWIDEVKARVYEIATCDDSIAIVGHQKDASSYYLQSFPDWQHIDVTNFNGFNATGFRNRYFGHGEIPLDFMVATNEILGSYGFLKAFMKTETYADLCEEYLSISEYKKAWSVAPYAPVFVTTDAMLIVNDHLLLVKRRYHPGKNLWAFPGGFLDHDERIVDGVIRELYEETRIDIKPDFLLSKLKFIKAFDYPERSLRGRTITHLGVFSWQAETLPCIRGDDDAMMAKWWPLDQVMAEFSDQLMDDHYQIIKYVMTLISKNTDYLSIQI